MSASTAVGAVSESLRNLLAAEMTIDPEVAVTVLAPDEGGGSRRVNLFLYQVRENTAFVNVDWQVSDDRPDRLVPPPLSLNLYYLLTVYAPNDAQTGNSEAHAILGEAMRVLHDHAIVPSEHLAGDLDNAREQVKIIHNPVDLEELSTVWTTFTQPFRLSVLYEVSVVQLDAASEAEQPMAPRVRRIGVPDVRAPFLPPVVGELRPSRAAPGEELAFLGEHLHGWKAHVTVTGRVLATGLDLTADRFTVRLPADISLGVHEVRVDVSDLFRTTFFLEVEG
jgi:hypothetical protein